MGLIQRGRPWVGDAAEMWARIYLYLLLAIHAGLLAWGAVVHSPTIDEPVHLTAGLRHLKEGRFDLDRGNPPLANTVGALPVALMAPLLDWGSVPASRQVALDFVEANGVRIFWYTTVGRWACIPIALVGGIICYRWARELYGCTSGLLALTLWCFSPNVIAHGQLITGDMSAMAFGLLAFYAFWRWLCRPTAGRAVLAGVALGFSELAKFVWVISYALWPLLWLVWRSTEKKGPPRRELVHIVLLLALSVGVINLGYGFRGTLQPLGRFRLGQQLLGDRGKPEGPLDAADYRGWEAWVAAIPVPLPGDYMRGIGEINSLYGIPRRGSYLRGEWKLVGWWYYYIYGLFVKVPLGTWTLIGLAGATTLFGKEYARKWRDELLLVVPIVELLVFVTCVTTMQHHVRYVMPVLPFAFVFSSKLARVYAGRRWLLAVAAAGLGWSVASSLAAYPHSLSYFNELAGGPMKGHHHLLDSNIAWGQDLLFLKRWLDEHPQARPLYVTDSDIVKLSLLGIDYRPPPRHEVCAGDEGWPPPGWYVLSVDHIHQPGYEYYLHLHPVATAGYSLYIYHVGGPGSPEE